MFVVTDDEPPKQISWCDLDEDLSQCLGMDMAFGSYDGSAWVSRKVFLRPSSSEDYLQKLFESNTSRIASMEYRAAKELRWQGLKTVVEAINPFGKYFGA